MSRIDDRSDHERRDLIRIDERQAAQRRLETRQATPSADARGRPASPVNFASRLSPASPQQSNVPPRPTNSTATTQSENASELLARMERNRPVAPRDLPKKPGPRREDPRIRSAQDSSSQLAASDPSVPPEGPGSAQARAPSPTRVSQPLWDGADLDTLAQLASLDDPGDVDGAEFTLGVALDEDFKLRVRLRSHGKRKVTLALTATPEARPDSGEVAALVQSLEDRGIEVVDVRRD